MRWIIYWLMRRDSDAAQCVCIEMAHRMDDKGLRDMADYFKAMLENRNSNPTEPGDAT